MATPADPPAAAAPSPAAADEPLLRALAEHSPLPSGLVEMALEPSAPVDVLHLYDNAASCRFFGLPREATRGRWASTLGASPEVIARWVEHYRRAAASGTPVAFEYPFRAGDRVRWLRATVAPAGAGDAGRLRFCYVAEDITEAKRLERALREREADLARIERIGRIGGFEIDLRGGFANRRSPQYLRIHGLPPEAVHEPHEAWVRRLHPEDRERVDQAFRALVAGDAREYANEYRIVTPAGEVRWITAVGEIERDASGQALRMRGAHVDVTALRNAQATLRERELRLRALSDAVPGMLWECDAAGRLTWSTDAWARYTGLTHAQLAGTGWLATTHPQDVPTMHAAWRAAVDGGRDYEVRLRLRRRDGQWRWHLVRAAPMRDPGQPPEAGDRPGLRQSLWAGVSTDIHELALAEQRLAEQAHALGEQARALGEADARKDEFLAMLSHELRNPLAALTNAIALLSRDAPGEGPGAAATRVAERQLRQLTRLVNDLLEASRIARGKIELQRAPTTLEAVLREAAEAVEPAIASRGQRLTLALPPCPLPLVADHARLLQVFGNLLHNASKYAPAAGRVGVAVTIGPQDYEVSVTDDGVGIERAALPRLFELFTQLQPSIDRAHGGLGIGLALVRRLVELHGGSVSAASDGPGRGATFVVRLPRAADTPR